MKILEILRTRRALILHDVAISLTSMLLVVEVERVFTVAFAGDLPAQITTVKDAAWALQAVSDRLELVIEILAGATAILLGAAGYLISEIVKLNRFMGSTEAFQRDVTRALADISAHLQQLRR